jgi:hypothetical protein
LEFGYSKCITLEKRTLNHVDKSGLSGQIGKLVNFGDSIAELIINQKVIFRGRVPSLDKVKALISESKC